MKNTFDYPKLNLPLVKLKIREIESGFEVWDVIRKKYIVLTPEEWVRQHWIHFLNTQYGYPFSLMEAEKNAKTSKHKILRFDLKCYNKKGKPILLVECKEPNVKLSVNTIEQLMDYTSENGNTYLIISNGMTHKLFCKNKLTNTLEQVKELPTFSSFN